MLAYTAAHMITQEPKFSDFFADKPVLQYLLIAIVIVVVLLAGYLKKRTHKNEGDKTKSHPATH
ncbi:hypothetical protein D3C81_2247540 [compost metagenome]